MAEKEDVKHGPVEIKVDEETVKGRYVNLAHIVHSPEDFTIDFIYVSPRPQVGILEARVILSPSHAKRLVAALQENINKFETTFGPIQSNPEPIQMPSGIH